MGAEIMTSTGGTGLTIWDCLVLAATGPFGDATLVDVMRELAGSESSGDPQAPRQDEARRIDL